VTHILALDTTSKHASIAISEEQEVLVEYNFAIGEELSASLVPSLGFILGEAGLKPADIDVYGITTGPGLFTGIRVGLATLKGLLFGLKKPVAAVTTLEASAYKCSKQKPTVISLIDARRNEVYMAGYESLGEHLKEMISPRLVSINEVPDELKGLQDKPKLSILFTGSGAAVHEGYLKETFPKGEVLHRSYFLAPEVCKITAFRFASGNYLEDLQQLMPVYIRKPDAEVNYGKIVRK
jgi:tRNA threonylcarbamoyl adenosine modification protein YeaZ